MLFPHLYSCSIVVFLSKGPALQLFLLFISNCSQNMDLYILSTVISRMFLDDPSMPLCPSLSLIL